MIEPRTLENTSDDDLLTLEELAAVLRTKVWTVRRQILKPGLLRPSFYVGRNPVFLRSDVVKFIRACAKDARFAIPVPPKRRPKK